MCRSQLKPGLAKCTVVLLLWSVMKTASAMPSKELKASSAPMGMSGTMTQAHAFQSTTLKYPLKWDALKANIGERSSRDASQTGISHLLKS